MPQNKNKKKVKTKVSQAAVDTLLLKKLPGLLAICEFALIPFLVVFPSQGGTQGAALQEHTISPTTPNEVQIAAITDIPPQIVPLTKQVIQVTVTAYSSTEDQTDHTPFHTANGSTVRDGIVAANFLPLGAQLRIPEVFGDKIFTVLDRMHERFDQRIDIWMPTREAAQEFGLRYLIVEIL